MKLIRLFQLCAASVCLPAAALHAQPSARPASASVEERLRLLEEALAGQQMENATLRQQLGLRSGTSTDAAPAVPPSAVTFAGKQTRLVLGGLAHLHAEAGGAPDARYNGIEDRFQLRRLRLTASGAFTEHVAFKIETDFGNIYIPGTSGYRGQISDAYVAWTKYPALNIQAGQFKTPFGHDQLTSDAKLLFVERSLASDRLTVSRQIGAMAAGNIFGKVLGYAVGLFNGNGINNGANDNSEFMRAGRITATAYDDQRGSLPVRWTVGANAFSTVDRGAFTGRRTGFGVDTQLVAGPSQFGFEWLRNDYSPTAAASTVGEGWLGYSAWKLNKQWQLLVRFDYYEATTRRASTTTREWTYGVTYFLHGDDLKLSLNLVRGAPPSPAPAADRVLGRMQVLF